MSRRAFRTMTLVTLTAVFASVFAQAFSATPSTTSSSSIGVGGGYASVKPFRLGDVMPAKPELADLKVRLITVNGVPLLASDAR